MISFKILIVEDEVLIADSIQRYLNKKGYRVTGTAISYEAAKVLYVQEKPDIVLLDIKLNGSKSGIDFAYFIQQQVHPVPFIFLTSQTDIKHIRLAKMTLPAGYLSKPIQQASLFASIEIALHNYQASQEKDLNILLYDGKKKYLTAIKDILFIQAEHVYIKVHTKLGNPILQRSTFKTFLGQLPHTQFFQTHRSFAINIQQVNNWDSEHIYIGEQVVPISRSRKKQVLEMLQQVF